MATAPGHFLLSFPFPAAAPAPTARPSLVSLRTHSSLSSTGPLLWAAGTPRAVQCDAASGGYNVQVVVGDDEPEEALLRRFRREVSRAGVIQECKRRRFFENKQEEKKRKAREASKRNRRRRSGPRFTPTTPTSNAPQKKADDGDDNWEMPTNDNGLF